MAFPVSLFLSFPQKRLPKRHGHWCLVPLEGYRNVRSCSLCVGKAGVYFAGRQVCTGIPNFSDGSCDVGETRWYIAVLVKSITDFLF